MELSAVRIVNLRNELSRRHSSVLHSFFIIRTPFSLWKGEKNNMLLKANNHIYTSFSCLFMTGLRDGRLTKTVTGCKKQKNGNCKNLTIPFKMEIIFRWISHPPQHSAQHSQNTFSAKLTVRSYNNNNSFQL